jgi:HD-GYP domain-containing protein (c-di-GMP phosphodiesterase class II)
VYGEVLTVSRGTYKSFLPAGTAEPAKDAPLEENAPPVLTLSPLQGVVRKIVLLLRAGDQEIIALADRIASDHFLFSHVANVTIYALRLGMAIEMPDEELETLGLCSFLHDVGMAAHMETTAKPTKLSDEEARAMHTHVEEGRKLLDAFTGWTGDLLSTVKRVVGETHERGSGQGYPGRLSSDDIHPFAKIIGLCDVYEALTHMRPWRPRAMPHDVLRSFIEENPAGFEDGLIRAFVNALSLYPPGSFVRLSSGEIGRVLSATSGLTLRPKVWVMIDAQGARVDTTRVINLVTRPTLYITDAIDETKIKTSDQRLSLALRAQRWWVRGL